MIFDRQIESSDGSPGWLADGRLNVIVLTAKASIILVINDTPLVAAE